MARLYAADVEAGGPSRAAFCSTLHERGFALLRLPEDASAEIAAIRAAAAAFFALPSTEKLELGDFTFVGSTYAGYRDDVPQHGAEFLELHLRRDGTVHPALPVSALPKPPCTSSALRGHW